MAKNKSIKLRLTENEFERITLDARSKGFSMAEVLRDFIKSLDSVDPGDPIWDCMGAGGRGQGRLLKVKLWQK